MFKKKKEGFRQQVGNLLFSDDHYGSKIVNILLIILILISSLAVILESVDVLREKYGQLFFSVEFIFIIIFGIEYVFRVYSARKRSKYIFSLYGIIDFISVFPALLSLFFQPFQYLLLLRIFRVFRVFRILKLMTFLKEESNLILSLKKSIPKISLFIIFILIISTIFASFMYLIEGKENGFTDIPTALYFTIVTISTVGYGDIAPQTNLGKTLASLIMLSGYAVIAVPTGIVVSEYNKLSYLSRKLRKK